MAQGSVVSALISTTAAAFAVIQPPVGQEWVLHNIYSEAAIGLYLTSAGAALPFRYVGVGGIFSDTHFHLTNITYLKVLNSDSSASHFIGYDGIQTV